MSVFINPGSGPVEHATIEYATTNMAAFMDDLVAGGHSVQAIPQVGKDQGDGRWLFKILVDGIEREIEMPGLPRERVRWMDEPEQNIWDFPRLYVDGSSWIWKFALSACEPDDDGPESRA